MLCQPLFVDETDVVHGGIGARLVIFQPGNAHHELFAGQAKPFFQRQVAVDVLAEFAAFALDANWRLPIDEQEDIKLVSCLLYTSRCV